MKKFRMVLAAGLLGLALSPLLASPSEAAPRQPMETQGKTNGNQGKTNGNQGKINGNQGKTNGTQGKTKGNQGKPLQSTKEIPSNQWEYLQSIGFLSKQG